jgi:hypothetical protein
LEFDFLRSDKENTNQQILQPNRTGKINFSDSEKRMIVVKHLKSLTTQVCINFQVDLQREMKYRGIDWNPFYSKMNLLG